MLQIDRAELERSLAKLKKQEHEDELASLAEQRRVQAEREGAEAERQRRLADMKRELNTSIEHVLDHVERAEGLLRSYNEAVESIIGEYAEISRLSHLISGKSVPISASAIEVENRFANRHAAVMSEHRPRLGHLQWPSSWVKANESWAKSEAALIERHINPLTEESD